MKKYFLQFIVLTVLLSTGPSALAQLKIEVTGVGSDQIPISVAGFADDLPGDQAISAIVRADLVRSGMFRLIESNEIIPDNAPLDAAAWKARGADAVVTGSVIKGADGRIEIRYRLRDVTKVSDISQLEIKTQGQFSRTAAHRRSSPARGGRGCGRAEARPRRGRPSSPSSSKRGPKGESSKLDFRMIFPRNETLRI